MPNFTLIADEMINVDTIAFIEFDQTKDREGYVCITFTNGYKKSYNTTMKEILFRIAHAKNFSKENFPDIDWQEWRET